VSVRATVGGKAKQRVFAKSDQFGPEVLYFSDCVLENKDPEPSGRDCLSDVRVILALYE